MQDRHGSPGGGAGSVPGSGTRACCRAAAVFEGFEGTQRYSGPDSVIATGRGLWHATTVAWSMARRPSPMIRTAARSGSSTTGSRAIPRPRFDPKTGLPVCDDKYPPGTVLGVYETSRCRVRRPRLGSGQGTCPPADATANGRIMEGSGTRRGPFSCAAMRHRLSRNLHAIRTTVCVGSEFRLPDDVAGCRLSLVALSIRSAHWASAR